MSNTIAGGDGTIVTARVLRGEREVDRDLVDEAVRELNMNVIRSPGHFPRGMRGSDRGVSEPQCAEAVGGPPRRQLTDEFTAGAVRLVPVEGRTVTQLAHDLDLTRSALGDRLAVATTDDDRRLHFALRAEYADGLGEVDRRLSAIFRNHPISSRLKSPDSVVAKLHRTRTRLSSMQDIAGRRLIIRSLAHGVRVARPRGIGHRLGAPPRYLRRWASCSGEAR